VGVAKSWYFVVDYNYWFPPSGHVLRTQLQYDQSLQEVPDMDVEGNKQAIEDPTVTIPNEAPNETLLGSPTVEVNKLRKTFGSQVSVNHLSFKMYENQIFALLGHNGAGKVLSSAL